MREIAGLGQCARHARIAIVEQAVQVADQRHHLGRIRARQPPLVALLDAHQLLAQDIKRSQPSPHKQQADAQTCHHDNAERFHVKEYGMKHAGRGRIAAHQVRQQHARRDEQRGHPENGTDKDAGP
jgi:hypothetical protein